MTETVLQTEGLTKRFGELSAVDHVDLEVEAGEFRRVIGPNGAGKTTTFNLITGALIPTEGTVRFNGEDITTLPPHERVHRGVGRSFHHQRVRRTHRPRERPARRPVRARRRDQLREAMFRDKDSFPELTDRTNEILSQIGLRERAEETAQTLAYGDQRRLEIGLVLATDPELVMLDEPTAGMSTEETQDTMDLIDDVLLGPVTDAH